MTEGSTNGGRLALTPRKIILGIALIIILISAVALGVVALRSAKETTDGSGTSQVSTPAQASEALKKLQVTSPGSMSGYSRDRFRH